MYTLLALASILSIVAAGPIKERQSTCKVIYPTYLGIIDSAFPTLNFGRVDRISTSVASPAGSFRAAEVQFDVPADARGACQLEYVLSKDGSINVSENGRQLSVYKTAPSASHPDPNFLPDVDTWNNSPAFGSQFGTFNVNLNTQGVINSEGCAAKLNYYVSLYEGWQLSSGSARPGYVILYQENRPGYPELGLRLRYGC